MSVKDLKAWSIIHNLEMVVFPLWLEMSIEKREEICRKLGDLEAKIILDEICESVTKSISTL